MVAPFKYIQPNLRVACFELIRISALILIIMTCPGTNTGPRRLNGRLRPAAEK